MAKKKVAKIVISSIVVLAIISFSLIYFVFLRVNPLTTPNVPTVVVTETHLYASTNEIEGANSYIFKFTSPDNNIIKISSVTPNIEIELYDEETNQYLGEFEKAGQYDVKCCAVGNKTQSQYSVGVDVDRYINLEKPVVNLFDSDGEYTLSWASIKNANCYDIYITSLDEDPAIYEYTPNESGTSVETLPLSVVINELDLENGTYQVIVVAKNSNEFYIENVSALPIMFEI
ncbi:MAG: hypothetical protein PHS54_02070 [Clostridia bacterium]|nr:hypothetical protein [Clostridia bacterium]